MMPLFSLGGLLQITRSYWTHVSDTVFILFHMVAFSTLFLLVKILQSEALKHAVIKATMESKIHIGFILKILKRHESLVLNLRWGRNWSRIFSFPDAERIAVGSLASTCFRHIYFSPWSCLNNKIIFHQSNHTKFHQKSSIMCVSRQKNAKIIVMTSAICDHRLDFRLVT